MMRTIRKKKIISALDRLESILKVFCPTGEGGGVDSTCSRGGGSVKTKGGEVLHSASRGSDGKWRMADGKDAPPHIQKLGIPPAWKDVKVNPDPKGNLFARGVDAKGRVQSRYSDNHTMKAAAAKFGRVSELRKKREQIFKEVEKDIKKGVEEALVTKLVMKTGMRPGGGSDTGADYKSYGATTLEGRHIVKKPDGSVVARFVPGKKKGQEIEMPISDKGLAKQLLDRAKAVGKSGRLCSRQTPIRFVPTLRRRMGADSRRKITEQP